MNNNDVKREIEQMQLNRSTQISDIAELVWYDLADLGHQLANDDGSINWEFLHLYDQVFAKRIALECALIAEQAEPYKAADIIRERFWIDG